MQKQTYSGEQDEWPPPPTLPPPEVSKRRRSYSLVFIFIGMLTGFLLIWTGVLPQVFLSISGGKVGVVLGLLIMLAAFVGYRAAKEDNAMTQALLWLFFGGVVMQLLFQFINSGMA